MVILLWGHTCSKSDLVTSGKKKASYPVKMKVLSSLLQNLHEDKVATAGGLTGKGTAWALLPGMFFA